MKLLKVALLCAGLGSCLAHAIVVRDAFGRDVTKQGIVLLDWDGFMANPAIRLTVETPQTDLRQTIDIRSDCTRLMFDRAGDVSNGTLGKTMRIAPGESKAEFWVSIFPDRDGKDESWTIELKLRESKEWTPLKVRIVDQDKGSASAFKVTTDFSQDRTGFLRDAEVRKTINQAAADWAYFIGDMNLDSVPKGSETSEVWTREGFVNTYPVKNAKAYKGFLLYLSGIQGPQLRSGGAPSYSGVQQTSKGKALPLLRSGTVEVEVQGSYTRYGWYVDCLDSNWWVSGSQATEPADFYSIMLHEMGHALGFESTYPLFGKAQKSDGLVDAKVREYLGYDPAIDTFCHFDRCIDPASGFGAFGSEFQARMKVRRWLITKSHLLFLQAIGYRLKPLSCFEELALPSAQIMLKLGKDANGISIVRGGVPSYQCVVTGGTLPPGVSLDEATGKLSGIPIAEGNYEAIVKVADQSPVSHVLSKTIAIHVLR